MPERLDTEVPNDTAHDLIILREKTQTSLTEVIRRAIGTYVTLENAARQGKGLEFTTTVLNEDDSGRLSSVTNRKYFRLEGDNLFFSETTENTTLD